MTLLTMPVRLALGLILFVFGLNGFFHFLPVPPMAPRAEAFIRALIDTGYMLPFWKGMEVATGLLILFNRFTALALVLVAPIIFNIAAFHIFLDPVNVWISLGMLSLWTWLAIGHLRNYRLLFEV